MTRRRRRRRRSDAGVKKGTQTEKGDRSGEALWLQRLQGTEQFNMINWAVNNY